MLEKTRMWLARLIAPPHRQSRMYHSAKATRLTMGFGGGGDTSADGEISTSLRVLRSRSRSLVRDAAYPKRAKIIIQNNVVGSGIGMQAQVMSSRGELREPLNSAIEEAWCEWCRAENCHTGGAMHFFDLERASVGQVFEAGEIFLRKHYRPFGNSKVPFALEVIEPERLPDETPQGVFNTTNKVRMCVEIDSFYRPVAYWIRQRHPGEVPITVQQQQGDNGWERVPANQIEHLRIVERWPQTRGVPWMHPVIRKLNDMDGYSEAEIIAARGAASYMAFIETDNPESPLAEPQADGTRGTTLEPGIMEHMAPGEKVNFVSPNRPNPAMDPFMRMMLREVAAGIGVSYESLSRDYSQSNYSSSRLALLDDRDLWRVLQQWFIRSFRDRIHREWLRQAVLAGAIQAISVEEYALTPEKFEAVLYKPRGWGWVNPKEDIESYKNAVRAGFTTVSDVIQQHGDGKDLEDVLRQRRRELDMMEEAKLSFDTDPEKLEDGSPAEPDTPERPPGSTEETNDDPPERVVSFRR